MQNIKFDFLENKISADWGVRFKFHFENLTQFYQGIFFKVQRNTKAKNQCHPFCTKMARSQIRRVAAWLHCFQKQAFNFVFGTSQINKQTQISSIFFYINCSK